MHALDLNLFNAIHGLAGQNNLLDSVIVFCAEYFIDVLLIVLAIFAFQKWRAGDISSFMEYVVSVAAGIFARLVVTEAIRFFYHRPRPFLALHIPHLLTDTEYSFPSGHTIFMFALATAMLSVNKKFAYVLYVCGLLIGLSRVAAGVHYPSDIVGGVVLGILTGYLVAKLWDIYVTRNTVQPSA